MFGLSAISNPQNAPKVEASIKDELAKTVRDGFTAAEVDAAKKAIPRRADCGLRPQDAQLLRVMELREEFDRTR